MKIYNTTQPEVLVFVKCNPHGNIIHPLNKDKVYDINQLIVKLHVHILKYLDLYTDFCMVLYVATIYVNDIYVIYILYVFIKQHTKVMYAYICLSH